MTTDTRVNVIVNLVRTLVLTLLSFITFPWVCRALQDSALGTYTWAMTFVSYFLIIAKIGIPNLAVRECVKVRDNKELLSNKVQSLFILQGIATIASFILMTIVVFSVPSLRDTSSIIFILSLNFLTGAFSFEWVFIALEKQFYMSVRNIATLTASAILTIIFVTTPGDIYIYAFISIGYTLVSSIINMVYIRRYISFKKTLPYNFKCYLKPMFVLFSVSLTLSLYNQTDTFILGFIDPNKSQVGSYSVGIKGVDIIIGIISNLGTVFVPRANYYYEKEDKQYFRNLIKYSMNICLFITIPAVITMIILAIPICSLISGNNDLINNTVLGYNDSYMVLMILGSMIITYSLGEIIYGQILIPMKKEKYYLYAIAVGVVLNIILSIVLGKFVFKDHPSIGVAIGTVFTDICIFIFLLVTSWKWIKPALFNKNTLKLFISNALICGTTIGLYYLFPIIFKTLPTNWLYIVELGGILLVDATIYIVSSLLLKEDLVMSFVKKKNQ